MRKKVERQVLILSFVAISSVPIISHAATLAELQAQLQVLMAQLSALQSQTQTTAAPLRGAASCPNLTRKLSRGSRGSDVAQLQQFLISQKLLEADSATSFFGAMTETAIKQFQCSKMSICAGSPISNGYGAVGPRTRTAIVSACTAPTSPSTPATPVASTTSVVPTQTHPTVPTPPTTPPTSSICTPLAPQTQTRACPEGQTGSITQSRTSSCAADATSPTWGGWATTQNSCIAVVVTPPVLNGAFDPVVWMNSTKSVGNAKLFGELWDENKQTWVKSGGPANPMKMVADYANRHVYFHKDSSWQDFVGQTYNFDANNVWIRTETMGYFNCTDVNPQTERCDHYTASTPWDIRNDKFRLFVSTNDAQSASHGYRLAPRPVTHGWQGLIDSFDTYYCNSFSELRTSTCSLYQRGNQILVSVYFYRNFDIFNDPSDRVVAMPSGTPEQKLFDAMVISIEQGLCDDNASASTPRCIAIERNFYGRVGNDYWGLVRFDNGVRKNGRYELTNRAVAYAWDKNYDPKFDDLKIRALEDDSAHFSPPLQTPLSPTGLMAACSADGKNVTLSWNASPSATGYNLAVDDTGNQSSGCSAPTVTGPNGTCVLTTDYGSSESTNTTTLGITPGRNYSWWLQSKNSAGVSPIPAIGTSFSCMNGG